MKLLLLVFGSKLAARMVKSAVPITDPSGTPDQTSFRRLVKLDNLTYIVFCLVGMQQSDQ
jgi:hypothetical protein